MRVFGTAVVLLIGFFGSNAYALEDGDFFYGDAAANAPVIEFFPAMNDKPSRGDFRKSTKPRMVEFYHPYCVSYFLFSKCHPHTNTRLWLLICFALIYCLSVSYRFN